MLLDRREAKLALEERRAPRSLGEIDYLLGVRDDVRQGALRYSQGTGLFLTTDVEGVPALTDLPEILELAARAERAAATLPDLLRLIHAGGSLGGARPKAHVLAPDGRLAIAKFPSADRDSWDVMAREFVALELAAATGVSVPPHQLIQVAERNVLLVERFVRRNAAGRTTRVGYTSAMTQLEARDGDEGSYLDIASAIEVLSDRTTEDLEQLWRRVLFSVAIGTTDDHLRNHGFLRAQGADAWRLAPAFDLNPVPQAGPQVHQTSLDGTGEPISVQVVLDVAPHFRLRSGDVERVSTQVFGAVSEWRAVATSAGLSTAAIEDMAPASWQCRQMISCMVWTPAARRWGWICHVSAADRGPAIAHRRNRQVPIPRDFAAASRSCATDVACATWA